MDNPKIELRDTHRYGKGLFAKEDIKKGEVIVEFDGPVFEAEKCTDLPKDIADHAIQFEEHKWKDSTGMARYINHSCEPNCGTRGLFSIVAMRDIERGEELTWDYDMTEDSDWVMDCHCGTKTCRKRLRGYGRLTPEQRKRIAAHTSPWLLKKYR